MEQIPNIITVLRMFAILPICWLLWQDAFVPAIYCLVLAGLSDGLDGFLARRYGWTSRVGAMLDPLADKLFIVSIMLLFGIKGYLPEWLVLLALGRDLVIVGGAMLYRYITGTLEMRPLFISKLNTAFQILLLLMTLLHVGFYPLSLEFMSGLQALVTVTTLFSGLAYVYWWTYYVFHKEVSV